MERKELRISQQVVFTNGRVTTLTLPRCSSQPPLSPLTSGEWLITRLLPSVPKAKIMQPSRFGSYTPLMCALYVPWSISVIDRLKRLARTLAHFDDLNHLGLCFLDSFRSYHVVGGPRIRRVQCLPRSLVTDHARCTQQFVWLFWKYLPKRYRTGGRRRGWMHDNVNSHRINLIVSDSIYKERSRKNFLSKAHFDPDNTAALGVKDALQPHPKVQKMGVRKDLRSTSVDHERSWLLFWRRHAIFRRYSRIYANGSTQPIGHG